MQLIYVISLYQWKIVGSTDRNRQFFLILCRSLAYLVKAALFIQSFRYGEKLKWVLCLFSFGFAFAFCFCFQINHIHKHYSAVGEGWLVLSPCMLLKQHFSNQKFRTRPSTEAKQVLKASSQKLSFKTSLLPQKNCREIVNKKFSVPSSAGYVSLFLNTLHLVLINHCVCCRCIVLT